MVYYTILIYVKNGKEEVFKEYENQVLPLLKEHNGVLVLRTRPTDEQHISGTIKAPYEIHLIAFNSEQDFSNYLKNEKRNQWNNLKQECIETVYLYKGQQV